jgi:hypothetical protein
MVTKGSVRELGTLDGIFMGETLFCNPEAELAVLSARDLDQSMSSSMPSTNAKTPKKQKSPTIPKKTYPSAANTGSEMATISFLALKTALSPSLLVPSLPPFLIL